MTDIGRALEILMQEHGLEVGQAAQRLQLMAQEHGVRLPEEATRIVDAYKATRVGEPPDES